MLQLVGMKNDIPLAELLGEVNINNVDAVCLQGLTLIKQHPKLFIDFTQTVARDSALIALLIEWLKFVRSQQGVIKFYNLPPSIASIIQAARIEALFQE